MTPPPLSTPLLLLLLLIPLSLLCDAQSDNAPSPPPPPPQPFYNGRFNPSMAIIIVILVIAFFFLGFFSIYLRQCGNGEEGTVLGSTGRAMRSRRAAARGLDSSIIESFPTLVYSDVKEHKIGKGALECAVCLCEFEDDETLRLLPRCDHVFHPECIDTWLSSHTTCPVCRDNLAVNDDAEAPPPRQPVADLVAPPPPPPAAPADVTVDVAAEEQPPLLPDHVALPVVEDEAAAATVEGDRRLGVVVADLGRNGSKRSGRSLLSWRSRSARAAMQHWAEEDRERFTLRLPEYVRRDVLVGKLNRSASVAAFRAGEESSRRGYRGGGGGGEGSSRGGGRSFKMGGRLDSVTWSDRWAFLSRPLSFKITRGGDGEGSSIKRGEGSARKGGDGDGEGLTKGKVFARGPLDCLGGGGGGVKEGGDGEGSTLAPAKV